MTLPSCVKYSESVFSFISLHGGGHLRDRFGLALPASSLVGDQIAFLKLRVMFPSAPAAPARLVPPPLLVPLAGVAVEAGDSLRVGLARGVVLEHLEHGSPPSPYRSE